ncbi:hypothetical protein [Hyphomicrobium sp.]|uniref:hypothetical protein n=1 Tax=Hyphomicrobium sp. TaxID=82 RepID=UPI001D8BD8AF|nr:hypothetical protein [Hyphomicrobium sp.]MBY0560124.1 hypothetical protein [Hyphomicrobium sp.]
MAKKANRNIDVAIPGSLTDIVEAINELMSLVERTAGRIKSGADLWAKTKSKNAAQNLSNLAFGSRGTKKHLEKIAAGKDAKDDLTAIAAQLEATSKPVEQSIEALRKYRDQLREQAGMRTAQKLDDILYGQVGKLALRNVLRELADTCRQPEPPADIIVRLAKEASSMIESLNKDLATLHDMLLGLKKKWK